MKLSRLGEFGLIERIRRATPKSRGVLLGIGDDAAWVKNKTETSLITSDLLIENIHFNLKWTSPFALGYKTLAVNLSDIAAMGGIPAYLILSLGIPINYDSKVIAEFYRGIKSLASGNGVALIGGDTNVAPAFFISACVIGHAPYPPVTRSGARAGNDIFVTGTLGDSALALKLLASKSRHPRQSFMNYLLVRHHHPTPRLGAGALLARERLATAMIDISDGLLQDLGHLCKASGVGAVVREDKLPLSAAYRSLAGREGTRWALAGGEDYELLFCARRRDRARIEGLQKRAGVTMTKIGTCIGTDARIKLRSSSGATLSVRSRGHDHFRRN